MGVFMNIDIDKRELISRRDAIEAVTDYIFFDVYGGMKLYVTFKVVKKKTVDITDNK